MADRVEEPFKPAVQPRTSPPRAIILALLAMAAVELPFIIGLLLSRGVSCRHCRDVWLTKWYSLPALPFVFLSGVKSMLTPPWGFGAVCLLVTVGMIALVFLLCRWNRKWKAVLIGAFLFFCVVAMVTHAILAA